MPKPKSPRQRAPQPLLSPFLSLSADVVLHAMKVVEERSTERDPQAIAAAANLFLHTLYGVPSNALLKEAKQQAMEEWKASLPAKIREKLPET